MAPLASAIGRRHSNASLPRSLRRVVDLAIQLQLVDRLQDLAHRGPGRSPKSSRCRPSRIGAAARCSTPSARARSRNQSIAEQSNAPVRPWQSARAKRASSSRSTFCASRRNAPSLDRRPRLVERARLQVVRDEAEHLRAHVEAVERVDVEAIEQRVAGSTPGFFVVRATGCGRRSPPSSPACRGRGRRRRA